MQPIYSDQDPGTSVLPSVNIKALTASITKKEVLDERVQSSLATLADEIIDDVVEFACKLAKHRGSNTLQRDDVKLAFEKRFKLKMPTRLHAPANNQMSVIPKPLSSTSNYKQNLILVKKALEHNTP
jgi:transcription initiation factor TFIID subunit TAF12